MLLLCCDDFIFSAPDESDIDEIANQLVSVRFSQEQERVAVGFLEL